MDAVIGVAPMTASATVLVCTVALLASFVRVLQPASVWVAPITRFIGMHSVALLAPPVLNEGRLAVG
jgi:hypothetical protein